jgi:hypothetical protein
MIAMACGFTALFSGGLLLASRVIHAMELRNSSDKTIMRTPLGDYRVEKAREVGPGLPVYPQSMMVLPGAESARISDNSNLPQVVSSIYQTNASREFVANWYVERLSPEFVRQDAGPKSLPEAFRGAHVSDDDIAFVGKRGDQIRVVVLTLDDAGTKITLLRSTIEPNASSPTP